VLIEPANLKKNIKPDEKVGSMDVLPTDELLSGFECLRDSLTTPRIIDDVVSNETRDHHVQISGDCLFEARLEMFGLPCIVIVEDGDEPQIRLQHDLPIAMQLVDAAIPSAGCTRQRSPIAHHGHGTVFAKGLLNLVSESLSRGLGELYFGLIHNDHEPIGQARLREDRGDRPLAE